MKYNHIQWLKSRVACGSRQYTGVDTLKKGRGALRITEEGGPNMVGGKVPENFEN